MQINLLPWRQLRAKRQLVHWYQRAVSAFISSSLLLFGTSVGLQQLHRQQQRQWRTAQLQTTAQTCRHGEEWQKRLQQQYQQAEHLLNLLPRVVPKGVYLQRVQWQPTQLTLQGAALNYLLLASVIDKLQHYSVDGHPPFSLPQCSLACYQLKTVQATTDNRQIAPVQFSLQLHYQSHAQATTPETDPEIMRAHTETTSWN